MPSWWGSLWIALALGLGGCGGSIWDDQPNIGVEGRWAVTETITEQTCLPSRADRSYTIIIVQDGTSIQVFSSDLEDPDPNPFTGSFDGDTLTWEGSFMEADGTTTIEDMTLTLSGDFLTGTSTWTWTDDTTPSCGGTSEVTATRTP